VSVKHIKSHLPEGKTFSYQWQKKATPILDQQPFFFCFKPTPSSPILKPAIPPIYIKAPFYLYSFFNTGLLMMIYRVFWDRGGKDRQEKGYGVGMVGTMDGYCCC
jgi:hypothetical protein